MYFLVIDLEWNSVYLGKRKMFLNEIIEIGAVLTDEDFNAIDSFSVLVKSQFGRKLTNRVKKLTNISNEELETGLSFQSAIKELKQWIDGRECVFLSWGNGDIRVLIENYKMFFGKDKLSFMKYYADMQKFCQDACNIKTKNQVGLATVAACLGIDSEKYYTHRALEDSKLSLKCLKKSQMQNNNVFLDSYIQKCNDSFYKRLAFKTYNITNINSNKVDRSQLRYYCDKCGEKAKRLSEWKVSNQAFRALVYCDNCDELYVFSVRFKASFDGVDAIKYYKKVDRR